MEVKVPDIGDFDDVPVIEVLVAVGDEVAAEDPLITLESDKATMEVPSPAAGKVATMMVAVGDKVSEGTVHPVLDSVDGDEPAAEQPPAEEPAEPAAPAEDATSTSRSPCSAPARAATRRRSAPPTSA